MLSFLRRRQKRVRWSWPHWLWLSGFPKVASTCRSCLGRLPLAFPRAQTRRKSKDQAERILPKRTERNFKSQTDPLNDAWAASCGLCRSVPDSSPSWVNVRMGRYGDGQCGLQGCRGDWQPVWKDKSVEQIWGGLCLSLTAQQSGKNVATSSAWALLASKVLREIYVDYAEMYQDSY